MKPKEIASRINAHLKRFERDPTINAQRWYTSQKGERVSMGRPYYTTGSARAVTTPISDTVTGPTWPKPGRNVRKCGMCGRKISSGEALSYRVTAVTPLDATSGGRVFCWFCSDCFGGKE